MAWMLRWWQAILSAFARDDGRGWVEPSNAITRAILAAPAPPVMLPMASVQPPAPVEEAGTADEPPSEPAVRTRRRRGSRAA